MIKLYPIYVYDFYTKYFFNIKVYYHYTKRQRHSMCKVRASKICIDWIHITPTPAQQCLPLARWYSLSQYLPSLFLDGTCLIWMLKPIGTTHNELLAAQTDRLRVQNMIQGCREGNFLSWLHFLNISWTQKRLILFCDLTSVVLFVFFI